MTYLSDLNEKQREAAQTTIGPVLILAGAGAGKTKTVTYRILHLIKQGTAPKNILAITFTNKAAKEMRERVMALIAKDKELNLPLSFNERPFVSTFHSLGVHIIKENAQRLGLTRHFTIFDRSDSRRAVKAAVVEMGLDPKQYDPSVILSIISKEKGNCMNVDKFSETVGNEYMREIVWKAWQKYEVALKKEKALDFDDLLLKAKELLEIEEVRIRYTSLWKYVHIDEYQDTNKVQYSIAKLITGESKNICVVGDVDQNIYSWRGADIKNILNFERDFPGAKMVTLEENYRSTQTILEAANHIIKKNKNRFEKNLFTRQGPGEKIKLYQAFDEGDEARFVAATAAELIENGVDPREIAVLYRANFQSRALEEAMIDKGLDYQVLGVKFFERKEVRDVLSFVRAALNRDSITDIERIINVPPRGIGKVSMAKIFSGMIDAMSPAHQEKWRQFNVLLDEIRQKSETERPSEVVKFVVKYSGLEDMLKDGTDEDLERLENIKELASLAMRYDVMPQGEGISKLLEDAALATDQDEMEEEKRATRLMTVHASKGLEFEYVFITGLEQDLFPHRGMESKNGSKRDEEEERRLFYVALTRAKKRLYLSYASIRTIFGSRQMAVPSEFVLDIPDEHLAHEEKVRAGGKVIYFDI
ncbi:MAG: UvrD-helicase domain-containing protein [bacterium]|nr:UvrD-helicase domain-containing protein [bacterium]